MGKRSRFRDRGSIYGSNIESDMALQYAIVLRKLLETAGYITFLLAYDSYKARHQFCSDMDFDLHVQCHFNSSIRPANYSALIFRKRDKDGTALATIIKSKWTSTFSTRCHLWPATHKDKGWWYCLAKSIPSIILEPLFINNEDHLELLYHYDGFYKIGRSTADAITEWDKGEEYGTS